MKQYYFTQTGRFIDESNTNIPQEQGNPLYEEYILWLTAGGEVLQSSYTTPEEDRKKEEEVEYQKYLIRIEDGSKEVAKISSVVRVKKIRGEITDAKQKEIDKEIERIKIQLNNGQWISAKDELILVGSNKIGVELYNMMMTDFNNYIAISYV